SGPGLRGDRHAAGLREPPLKRERGSATSHRFAHPPRFPALDREGEPAVTRRSRATALVAATAIALTACSGGGSDDGSVELTMLAASYSDNTKKLWEEVIAEFEDANPGVTVNLEIQSWENINDVIRTRVQTNKAPDILSIDTFAGYVEDDLLYSADELEIGRASWRDRRRICRVVV